MTHLFHKWIYPEEELLKGLEGETYNPFFSPRYRNCEKCKKREMLCKYMSTQSGYGGNAEYKWKWVRIEDSEQSNEQD